jgi:hypothetical protein
MKVLQLVPLIRWQPVIRGDGIPETDKGLLVGGRLIVGDVRDLIVGIGLVIGVQRFPPEGYGVAGIRAELRLRGAGPGQLR